MPSPLLTFSLVAALAPFSVWAQATPERTIRENRVISGKADNGQGRETGVPGQTLDSVLWSTENLNLIRDGFLRRLSGDGCPPDVAARVADLRAQLHEGETRHGGVPAAAEKPAAASERSSAELESALFVLASTWYTKRSPDTAAGTARASADQEAERAGLLEAVLASESQAAAQASDTAKMRAELERLLAGCRSGKE
jgi:hypothetical protein